MTTEIEQVNIAGYLATIAAQAATIVALGIEIGNLYAQIEALNAQITSLNNQITQLNFQLTHDQQLTLYPLASGFAVGTSVPYPSNTLAIAYKGAMQFPPDRVVTSNDVNKLAYAYTVTINNQANVIASQQNTIATLNSTIAARDATIVSLNNQITSLNAQITNLQLALEQDNNYVYPSAVPPVYIRPSTGLITVPAVGNFVAKAYYDRMVGRGTSTVGANDLNQLAYYWYSQYLVVMSKIPTVFTLTGNTGAAGPWTALGVNCFFRCTTGVSPSSLTTTYVVSGYMTIVNVGNQVTKIFMILEDTVTGTNYPILANAGQFINFNPAHNVFVLSPAPFSFPTTNLFTIRFQANGQSGIPVSGDPLDTIMVNVTRYP